MLHISSALKSHDNVYADMTLVQPTVNRSAGVLRAGHVLLLQDYTARCIRTKRTINQQKYAMLIVTVFVWRLEFGSSNILMKIWNGFEQTCNKRRKTVKDFNNNAEAGRQLGGVMDTRVNSKLFRWRRSDSLLEPCYHRDTMFPHCPDKLHQHVNRVKHCCSLPRHLTTHLSKSCSY